MSRQGTKAKDKTAASARTNQDRYDATRRALLDSTRQLFTQYGYSGTNTTDVVDRANVTRGALYYHFRDKAELFEAVAEELVVEMREKVTGTGGETGQAVLKGLQSSIGKFQVVG